MFQTDVQSRRDSATPDVPRGRDEEFAEYMAARQPSLLRTAYVLTGNRETAEELVQASLVKLYLSWDKVRSRDSIDGYVRRVMVNENNSLWRRAWKRREVTVPELPDQPHEPEGSALGTSSEVWQFVQTLPRRQRAVVVLRFYEELSEAEVADVLGISVGTVKSQSSRALAALRSRMQP